ncbi:MAG: thymidylate synthase [bacterium]
MKSVKPIEGWPKLYHDILRVKDPTSHVGICTLWTEREVVEKIVSDLPYNVIGNLYSAQGINAMIRNVMANPNIRTIVIWGSEMSLSGHSLLSFMKNGIDEKRKIIKGRGEIEPEIPDEVIVEFREKIEVVDLRGRTKDQLIAKMEELSKVKKEPFSKKVREFPKTEPKVEVLPSGQTGFYVHGKTVAQTWLKLLNEIYKYGRPKHTRYSKNNELKEILNLTAVVESEDPTKVYFPEYLPFERGELEAYYAEIMTSREVPGVAYNYGRRMRLHFGVDQIQQMKDLLKTRPDSKKMLAVTADPKLDWSRANNGDTPCLVMILGSVQDSKFFLTAHFRSQDMVHGWPRNTFALRKLQKDIADYGGYPMGPLTMITHSAHMYGDDFALVENLLMDNYEKELGYNPAVHFEFDQRANFVVEVIDVKDSQVWESWSVRYKTQALGIAVQRELKRMPAKPKQLIRVTLADPDGGAPLKLFEGRTAQEVAWQITDWEYVKIPAHAMYVGTELQRAEEAIARGELYSQDPA